MLPWTNDRVRVAYYAGIKEPFIGQNVDSRHTNPEFISEKHNSNKTEGEEDDTNETYLLLLLRSSIYK